MGCPVLIASPNLDWSEELKKYFSSKEINSEIVNNGKDCELKAHQDKRTFIVLDIETKFNSSLEVLKHLRISSPLTKVILIAESKTRMSEFSLNEAALKELGAFCVLIRPFKNNDLLEKIDPILARSENGVNMDRDFQSFVVLQKQLRILHQKKGHLSDKLKLIAQIIELHEQFLRDTATMDKTINFSKETAFLIAECMENEKDYVDFLKAGDLISNSTTYKILVFCLMTAQCVEWASRRTMESLIHGILVREVGKITENISLESGAELNMSSDEIASFKLHPWKAVTYLESFGNITEPIKQIVYQRYELINAGGFPLGIAGNRIYPPVKILSLCESFATFISIRGLTPLEGLKAFMSDRAQLDRFDPMVVKGLIKSFISLSKRLNSTAITKEGR